MSISNKIKVSAEEIEEYAKLLPHICQYFHGSVVNHRGLGRGKVKSASKDYFDVAFDGEYRTFLFNRLTPEYFSYIELTINNHDLLHKDFVTTSAKEEEKIKKDRIEAEEHLIFDRWKDHVELVTSAPKYNNEWYCNESYRELNESDRELASIWANDEKNNDYTMARMLSARAAEKVAIKFYNSLGYKVNDISISQLNDQENSDSGDWKLYDLNLNDEICVDVKNVRVPVNSKSTYVEHCVSCFKNSRYNQSIIIAGVLSPYVKLDEINDPGRISSENIIKYLGETTSKYISKLKGWFNQKILTVSLDSMHFIPRWVFEFPDNFYAERSMHRSNLREFMLEYENHKLDIASEHINPIPAYLSCGIDLPEAIQTNLLAWQVKFYNRILPRNNRSITMPVLFLALLTHFLETVVQNDEQNYDPKHYRQLVFANHYDRVPLGIYDPLETIDEFIETLSTLWNHRDKTDLSNFETFKFNGVGLLEGKRVNTTKFETILAYCGGFIEGRGKCGNTPLILGENDNCPNCGKLICEICGHCSTLCSDCSSRMDDYKQNPRATISKTTKHYSTHQFNDVLSDDDFHF